jgi:hypothetical protein
MKNLLDGIPEWGKQTMIGVGFLLLIIGVQPNSKATAPDDLVKLFPK